MFGAGLGLWCAVLAGEAGAPPQPTPTAVSEAEDPGQQAGALLTRLMPTPLLLVGEQHDAPEHQALQRELVKQLAARRQLSALVLEMSEAGTHTTDLPSQASETQVREALRWSGDQGGWPWSTYAPVVMAAVRAGVPVLGGNLPRADMRAAMGNESLDRLLPNEALERQRVAIREGHCDLLPTPQIAPMTRIQIARDQTMARTAAAAIRPGQTVLLVAGNGHVQRDLGVPVHLPPDLAHRVVVALARPAADAQEAAGQTLPGADVVWRSPPRAPRDYCADMKRSMGR
ncbi:MAG TPA: hypothetical protein DCY64_03430 [Hydrogenophaga sp.]|nr:hypothetical protein [Hydrogenophaga sp.]HBU18642.1 hypothetical protein [Hydrogenophaga sp.]